MCSALAPRPDDLRHLARTDPDPRVRRRAHALLLVADGYPVAAVARLFGTGPNRIRARRTRFLAGGRGGLADEPRSGRPPKLDAAALAFLAEALEANPRAVGLPVTVWSIRDLREVLAESRGIRLCATTVHQAMLRLGYRYRRPATTCGTARTRRPWRRPRRCWPGCEKSADAPAALRLVYLDECGVHSHPRLAKVWQRRGRPLGVPAAGEDAKFAVFGALDYASGNVLWRTAGSKDGAAFVAFLDHLAEELPSGLLVVVLDNVGYHKGRLAKAWRMAHQDRIRPLWLPAYTPELNLIERVWRHLKDTPSCHRRGGRPRRPRCGDGRTPRAARGSLPPARPRRHRPGPQLL